MYRTQWRNPGCLAGLFYLGVAAVASFIVLSVVASSMENPGTWLCTLCGCAQELTPMLSGFDHITDS
jgi:hypothetical protein